jgi:predicted transcriptional regulator
VNIFHAIRKSSRQLGPLEQRMLDTLWAKGSATVRELREAGYTELAYTTVMTTLDRLFKKGLLVRTEEGRAFRYVPRLSRDELNRENAGHALRQLLDAAPASELPLSFLVEVLSDRDAQLLDDLQRAVEQRRRELGLAEPAEQKSARKRERKESR